MSKTRLRQQIYEFCEENWPDEEILLFGDVDGDPYDTGLIGIGYQQYKEHIPDQTATSATSATPNTNNVADVAVEPDYNSFRKNPNV